MIITKISDQEMRHLGGAGREEPLKGPVTSDPDGAELAQQRCRVGVSEVSPDQDVHCRN
jgi:hypothetical protein